MDKKRAHETIDFAMVNKTIQNFRCLMYLINLKAGGSHWFCYTW